MSQRDRGPGVTLSHTALPGQTSGLKGPGNCDWTDTGADRGQEAAGLQMHTHCTRSVPETKGRSCGGPGVGSAHFPVCC